MQIKLKRVYEAPSKSDGKRVLVERLWPRGVKTEDARLHAWMKDVAPSPALRKWYAHAPEKWTEFQRRYRTELAANEETLARLRALCSAGPVTFVYASKDDKRCSAAVLQDFLLRGL